MEAKTMATKKKESYKYKLNKEDGLKVLKGAGIAAGGVLIPALIETGSTLLNYFSAVVPQIDFGSWTPVAIVVSSVLINAARKLLAGIKAKK
jgi:hypothetical protein